MSGYSFILLTMHKSTMMVVITGLIFKIFSNSFFLIRMDADGKQLVWPDSVY